jgi:hypothetical protein
MQTYCQPWKRFKHSIKINQAILRTQIIITRQESFKRIFEDRMPPCSGIT